MTLIQSDTNSIVTRRNALRITSAVGFATVIGTTSSVAQSSGGAPDWEYDTEAMIHSSPTVVDSFVYVGNDEGDVYAFNASTGYKRWVFETSGSIRSSPLVVGGFVFVGSTDNNLYVIDAASGKEVWSFETRGPVISSPVVVDKTVYIGSRDGTIYAINAETGRQSWTYETGGKVDSSPIVINNTVFVGSYDGTLYAIDGKSGKNVWLFETDGEIQTSPTAANGMVYVSSEDTNVYAVDIESGEERWSQEFYRNGGLTAPTVAEGGYQRGTLFIADKVRVHAVNAAVGGERWSKRFDGSEPVAPTVINDHVIFGDESVRAVELNSVEEDWSRDINMTAAPTGAAGKIFVGSGNSVYALAAGTSGASECSRVTLGTLGHHGSWRYADQTFEIEPASIKKEQTDTIESDTGNDNTTVKNNTNNESPDEELTESPETNTETPGFGIKTAITTVSGAAYLIQQRLDNQ